jgi:hypothetical protein
MSCVRRNDLRHGPHLPALRRNFQPHPRRPGRDCHNACDRPFVRALPTLLVNPGGCIGAGFQPVVCRQARAGRGALRGMPTFYGPTGISLPTKTGVPDGCPVGDPPTGSTVTA